MTNASIRRATVASALALGLGLTAACGGGSDVKTATKAEFCKAYDSTPKEPKDPNDMKQVEKSITTWVESLEDTGLPKGIPSEAKEGFEVYMKQFDELDFSGTKEDIAKQFQELEDGLTKAEKKATDAFDKYESKTCE